GLINHGILVKNMGLGLRKFGYICPPHSPPPSTKMIHGKYSNFSFCRSALAAAILVTTLTGRTVAIPQPRQRSFSESDTSYLQDKESYVEPYATITELRMGQNWKSDGDERSAVQSLEISGSCCDDEDMDTSRSNTEKEPNSICQDIDKKECITKDALYAVPHKSKQVSIQVYVCLSCVNTDCKNHMFLYRQSPDVVICRKQGQMDLPRVKLQRLKEENWHIKNANCTLFSQLEEKKQQVKELQLKVKTLENENKQFKETAQNSHDEEEHAELLLLRQQAQELVDENDSLKMTVHRLNAELSRYQAKYRPISPNESLKIGSLPLKKPIPPWLLDMKYLSPLLLAYEDRMKEKENLILEDMKNFKARVEEIVKENEELHQQLSKNSSVTTKEWQQLQSQAKLVIEENTVLMEQLKIQQTKAKDNLSEHVQEVSKLTKQLMILEAKKKCQEEEAREHQKQLEELHSAYKELKDSTKDHISRKEHVALVNQCKSQLKEEQERREKEAQVLMEKLASVQAEKKSLLIEKNDLVAENKALEDELEMAQKTKRRSQKKIGILKQQLEESMEKEITAHQYLANLISLAENITQERDHLLNLASCLEKEKHGVLNKIIEGNVRLGRLEEKVKVYKKTAAGKLGDISLKVTQQEKEFAGKAAQYQREMKHLQRLLQEKQETLDEVLQQKREMESELEIIWESTTKENRRMKELLHKSLEKRSTHSPVKTHESHLADISQRDLLGGYSFSYCDVELFLPSKTENQEEPVC
uniref:Centrosomal protein 89 n=1 Tax=Varanus komodoensis TaxID=61221 RepID=A0A8D2L524_VARKO